MVEEYKPTVCVDLDGVLNQYSGWVAEDHYADPRPGAQDFVRALQAHYRVVIFTSRFPLDVQAWLDANNFPKPLYISGGKPPAVAYIDDRAICFTGSFDGLLDTIAAFKAHWER